MKKKQYYVIVSYTLNYSSVLFLHMGLGKKIELIRWWNIEGKKQTKILTSEDENQDEEDKYTLAEVK